MSLDLINCTRSGPSACSDTRQPAAKGRQDSVQQDNVPHCCTCTSTMYIFN